MVLSGWNHPREPGRARPGYAGTRAMQAVVHQGEQDEDHVTHSEQGQLPVEGAPDRLIESH